ncbi:transporter substrate-binding domain-containing protein [Pontiellaceae bacterium B12219]|nr:transporter substrate-binding domain-containing protein [Pontiellaceae bacterium B12219]
MKHSPNKGLKKTANATAFHFRNRFSLLLAAGLLFLTTAFSEAEELDPSPEEAAWLAEHPVIKLGFCTGLEPFVIQHEGGRLTGFLPELFNEIESLLDIRIEIEIDEWAKTVEKARNRSIDGLLSCASVQAEASNLLQVKPVQSFAPALFASSPTVQIKSLEDMHGKRVIYDRGAQLISNILMEHKEGVTILEASSAQEAMRSVLEGRADLYFGYSFSTYQISKYSYQGLNMAFMDVEHTSWAATAVRDDWPELQSLINKCINLIGPAELQQMLDRWTFHSTPIPGAQFTVKERQWMNENPSLQIVADKDGTPYSYINQRGEFVGILAEIFNRFEAMTSINISIEPKTYEKIVNDIKAGEQVVITGFDPPDYPAYTNSYTKSQDVTFLPFALFSLKNRDPKAFSPEHISDKKIAVVKGWDPAHPALLALGDCEVVYTENDLESINMVLQGRADALFEISAITTSRINDNSISELRMVKISPFGLPISIFTHNDSGPLHAIFEKVLTSFSSEERAALLKKWEINLEDPHYRLLAMELTETEREWILEHSEVKYGIDPDWNPMEWQSASGEPRGLSSDYLALLKDYLGIKFTYVPAESWSETIRNIKTGKIDMVPCIAIIEERKSFLRYTPSYLNLGVKIYVNEDANYIRSLSELKGKRLAMAANHAIVDLIRCDFPEIIIVEVDTLQDAVKALADRTVDALASDMLTTGHAINSLSIHSLKIGGDTPYTYNLAVGIRADDPVLASIISKALNIIPFSKREHIYSQWAPLNPAKPDYSIIWKIGIPLFILLLAAVSWSGLLKREVNRRTAALKTEKLRLKEAEAIAGLGHWEHNLETGETLWSEETFRILGQPSNTSPSMEHFYSLIHPDDRDRVKTAVAHAVQHGTTAVEDLQLNLAEAEKYVHFQCRTTNGIPKNSALLIGILQDITERVSIEETLYQSEKMQALGQLAGGVAHDFNNMLAGISGATELLGFELPKDSELHEYQSMILKSTRRAADLTQKLLSFSRRQPMRPDQLDLHQLIIETSSLLTASIDPRIKINLQLDAGQSNILGDASLLQNALLNIGINAAHAMPNGGTLGMHTAEAELDAAFCESSSFSILPGHYLELEISDTGCGMTHETIKRIFEPFFTTKERGKGTGLGLATVLGTIQQHGGSINVHSEMGAGSSFHIFLPLNAATPPAATNQNASVIPGQGTILFVDDDDILRLTVKAILNDLGYMVLIAENGKAGVEMYRKNRKKIDLVLLDMIMPVMNGYDCFKAIKAINPQARILLSSGFSQQDDVDEMLKAGLCGVIQKPYLSATLSQAVHDALHRTPSENG